MNSKPGPAAAVAEPQGAELGRPLPASRSRTERGAPSPGRVDLGGVPAWRTRGSIPGLQGKVSDEQYARLLSLTDTSSLRVPEDARARVEEIAQIFTSAGDARGLFSVVYRLITNKACASVEAGDYEREEWAKKLIVAFAKRYLDNLGGDLRGGAVTVPWQEYYSLAQDPSASRVQTLGVGIFVHLVADLPETLASIGSTPGDEKDFMTFGEILLQVFPDLVRDVRALYGADPSGLLQGLGPGALVDRVFGPNTATRAIYQTVRWKAWVMGQKLQDDCQRALTKVEISSSVHTMNGGLRALASAGVL